MKKSISRFAVLVLLAATLFWIRNSSEAALMSCGGSLFSAMYACDDTFGGRVTSYQNAQNGNLHINCNGYAASVCSNPNHPDYGNPNCHANQYNSCYTPAYNSAVTNYPGRYGEYGGCLNAIFNSADQTCVHSPDFCQEEYGRVYECQDAYSNPDSPFYQDYTAYNSCRSNIPHGENCLVLP